MIPLIVVAVVVLVVVARLGVPLLRRRRMAAQLRGDWWSRFEKEFHDHVARSSKTARDAKR